MQFSSWTHVQTEYDIPCLLWDPNICYLLESEFCIACSCKYGDYQQHDHVFGKNFLDNYILKISYCHYVYKP